MKVIILTGGSGTRMKSNKPKQFIMFKTKPLFIHNLLTLLSCDSVTDIVLVYNKEYYLDVETFVNEFCKNVEKISFVQGGITRQLSIKNAIEYLANNKHPDNNDVVIVHDGARPLVKLSTFLNVEKNVKEKQTACGIYTDCVSTVLGHVNGYVTDKYNRDKTVNSHTPQGFLYEEIYNIYTNKDPIDENETELLNLYMISTNKQPFIFKTDLEEETIKITTALDLTKAEFYYNVINYNNIVISGGTSGIGEKLVETLKMYGFNVSTCSRTIHNPDENIFKCDITKKENCEEFWKWYYSKHTCVNVLINNAGVITEPTHLEETTCSQIETSMLTNFMGQINFSKSCLEHMKNSKTHSIVYNVLSSSIYGGREGQFAYTSSKLAFSALTQTINLEYDNIDCFNIIPRRTQTRMREILKSLENCLSPSYVANVILKHLIMYVDDENTDENIIIN